MIEIQPQPGSLYYQTFTTGGTTVPAETPKTKRLEYELKLSISRDDIPADDIVEARNQIERWIYEGMQLLADHFTIDPDDTDFVDEQCHVDKTYINELSLKQTWGE